MSLYDECQGLEAKERPTGATQVVVTTQIDPGKIEALADAVEAAYPNMVPNVDAVEKGGVRPDGSKVVPFAAKQTFPVRGSVSAYYNGKVVWAGIEPLKL